jgi:hypothetical protein
VALRLAVALGAIVVGDDDKDKISNKISGLILFGLLAAKAARTNTGKIMGNEAERFFTKRLGVIILLVFLTALVTIILAGWVYFGVLGIKVTDPTAEDMGRIADYFGGTLGPLLSFLSLIALLATLYVQGHELKLSREELKLSREELAKSADALSSQNSTIERQRFEQTFFSWLGTYRQMVEEIYLTNGYNGSVTATGRKGLRDISTGFDSTVKSSTQLVMSADCFDGRAIKREGYPQAARIIQETWEKTYLDYESQLGGLFRTLFGLIRWVDQSNLSHAEKWFYISIIRAQLSSDELKLLFFTGITDKGRKFGILANKYALFDNFDLSKQPYANIMRESLSESSGYEPAAFSSEDAKWKYHS